MARRASPAVGCIRPLIIIHMLLHPSLSRTFGRPSERGTCSALHHAAWCTVSIARPRVRPKTGGRAKWRREVEVLPGERRPTVQACGWWVQS